MSDANAERDHVAVWDWPVRVVHWAIAILVAALLTTGLIGDEWLVWHMRFGQVLLALLIFRVLWGFVGSANARFASFLRGPRAVFDYARSLIRPPHHLHATHNPLGGWMVIVLLVVLLVQATTGLFTNDDVLYEGPLVKLITKDLSDAIGSWHRRLWWVIVVFASIHIIAVIVYFARLGDNLVVAMVSGEKVLPTKMHRAQDAVASTPLALILLALSAMAVWWVCYRL
ncbi:MAG: cytochrome b/b6 domain-containing protein [Betaproteobacteria bacterium]